MSCVCSFGSLLKPGSLATFLLPTMSSLLILEFSTWPLLIDLLISTCLSSTCSLLPVSRFLIVPPEPVLELLPEPPPEPEVDLLPPLPEPELELDPEPEEPEPPFDPPPLAATMLVVKAKATTEKRNRFMSHLPLPEQPFECLVHPAVCESLRFASAG